MKTQQTKTLNEKTETAVDVSALSFGDVVVYNEMADQTSVKLNLIEQIHAQLGQLEEMNHKRQFLMKEIIELIG